MRCKAIKLLEKASSSLLKSDDQVTLLLNDINLILEIMKSNVDLVELCVWLQLTTKLTDYLRHLKPKTFNKILVITIHY